MQHLTNYLKTITQNAHELTVQDSVNLLQEIKRAMAHSLQNIAYEQTDEDEKLMIQRHVQFVELFFEMVAGTFYKGKQETPLHDGVIVSERNLDQLQETMQREIKYSHEHLKRSLESILAIDDAATYGLNNLLDD
jgi:hypothetical protein